MMHITIIGFGNQAKAWAQNLKDSGYPVSIAIRENSNSLKDAEKYHLPIKIIGSQEFYDSSIFALLIPDENHFEFLKEHSEKMSPNSTVIYAHGFSMVKNKLFEHFPGMNHLLFAPKAIATELRAQFILKGKLGAVYSTEYCTDQTLHQSQNIINQLSLGLGINLGPFHTSFRNEMIADLFSEQGILCSLIPYVAHEMVRSLVAIGIEPEVAYLECWHELKLIINAMIESGPKRFFDLISPNALVGSEKGKNLLINDSFKNKLSDLLSDISNEKFLTEIEKTNINQLRNSIQDFWSNSELEKAHQLMKRK